MSIIGEKFKNYVQTQIAVRQRTHGKGFKGDPVRTPQELQILNNQNAWLKLSSSVRVVGNGSTNTSSSDDSISTSAGVERLRAIGLTNTNDFLGNKLAKKAVLFNTLSEVVPSTYGANNKISSNGTHNFRSGVAQTNSVWNMNSYGLGGTNFGLSPAPGLISAKIDCKNRGSIRGATVEIKCYNKFQFELLELLYLRLGYSMLLEWGWDKYLGPKGSSDLQKVENTLCEDIWFQDLPNNTFRNVIDSIEKYRERYQGNYDGFLGKVVNFDWKFGPDGTFDITLSLITIGDVIESLKVNLPQKMKSVADIQKITSDNAGVTANLLDTSIVQNAGTSTLAFKLYLDIVESNQEKWEGNSNYLGLFTLLKHSEPDIVENVQQSVGKEGKGVNIDKYNYFLTFGQLLEYINEYVIPSIQSNKMLQIDSDITENICSIFPMQVSLDPRVCFIKPFYLSELSANASSDAAGKSTYIKNWYGWNQAAKDFGITDAQGVMYGQIMNIYLNYNFVSDCLQDTTSNNEVFLFKFLSKICEGVNSSLGGLTKLEPILEDDNILKIIDQNPIPGIANSAEFGDRFKGQIVPFEIFGYNLSNPKETTSNFVRDFGLKTSISPDLASMISIGATAEGTKSKNYDGTAFSKWNEGLEDAYAMKYDDPSSTVEINVNTTNEFAPLTSEDIAKMKSYFDSQPEWVSHWYNIEPYGYKKYSKAGGVTGYSVRDIDNCPITGESWWNVTWAVYFWKVKWYLMANKPKEEPKKEEVATNYIQYLAVAFRGAINGVSYNDPNYFQLSEDFINLGKQLFKAYKTAYDNLEYALHKNPSNSIGFIPIDANIKIDGLSGIRIYQELDVQQGVLPAAYPKTVKFLITKVNHEISDNDWSTSLSTISTPNTKESQIPLDNIVSEIIVQNPDLGDANLTAAAIKGSPLLKTVLQNAGYKPGTFEYEFALIIGTKEGWIPAVNGGKGSRSYRNNNPGNLDYSKSFKSIDPGVTKEPGKRFARFTTAELGVKALIEFKIKRWSKGNMPPTSGNTTLIGSRDAYKKGTLPTIKQFMYTYAPPNENNTSNYINTVVSTLQKKYPKVTQDTIINSYLN